MSNRPTPTRTPERLQAQAASVRRWAVLLGVAMAVALAWGLYGVAARGDRDWAAVTLPASMLLLIATIFLKHRRGLYRLCAITSVTLLLLTFALPFLGRTDLPPTARPGGGASTP